jgi:anti-sigma factor RsiW
MSDENCPDRTTLLAYQSGELSEPAANSLIAHLADCPDCQKK